MGGASPARLPPSCVCIYLVCLAGMCHLTHLENRSLGNLRSRPCMSLVLALVTRPLLLFDLIRLQAVCSDKFVGLASSTMYAVRLVARDTRARDRLTTVKR